VQITGEMKSLNENPEKKTGNECLERIVDSPECLANEDDNLNKYSENISKTEKTTFADKFENWYFEIKPFEKNGKVYEYLGVQYFRKLVMGPIRKKLRKWDIGEEQSNYRIGKNTSIEKMLEYEKKNLSNEKIHFNNSQFGGFIVATGLITGVWPASILGGAFMLADIYCVMLQRYNRARLQNIIEKKLEHENSKLDKYYASTNSLSTTQ
jgi:hypothetical protein